MELRLITGFKSDAEIYLTLSIFEKKARKSGQTNNFVLDSIWFFADQLKKHAPNEMKIEDSDNFFVLFSEVEHKNIITPIEYVRENIGHLHIFGDNYDKTPYFLFDPLTSRISEGWPNAGKINDYRQNRQYAAGECYVMQKHEGFWYL